MTLHRTVTSLAAAVLLGTAGLVAAPAAQASTGTAHSTSAHPSTALGTSSLATLLAKDGSGFDHNWSDFDIVDAAVTAVLTAKPDSPVGVLADGSVPLTAFLPTDAAFRRLAHQLTGTWYPTEGALFTALAGARHR